jgi:WD40 repeat protein
VNSENSKIQGPTLWSLEVKPAALRPQWVEQGHSFLVAWHREDSDSRETLNLAVLPFDRRGPARFFQVSDLNNDGATGFYYWPVPVVGKYLFLTGQSNSIVRLDDVTGEIRRETNQPEMALLPSPDNDRLFYLAGTEKTNGPCEFGLVDPESFSRAPLFRIPKGRVSALSLALSRDGKSLAYQLDNDAPPRVYLLEIGRAPRTLSLASAGTNTEVMVRQFSPKGDVLYGSYASTGASGTRADYGLVEIPRDGSPVRKTVLIRSVPVANNGLFLSLQVDLSHDGKTVAVESLWLGYNEKRVKHFKYEVLERVFPSLWLAYNEHRIRAGDCSLFLVDVSKSRHKVTKVPIPLPPEGGASPFGR